MSYAEAYGLMQCLRYACLQLHRGEVKMGLGASSLCERPTQNLSDHVCALSQAAVGEE